MKFTKGNAWFNRIIDRMTTVSIIYLILFSLVADLFVGGLFSIVLFPESTEGPKFDSSKADFLLVVILAPIIETLVIQSWLIKKVLKNTNNSKLAAFIVSATVFGLLHNYSVPYILKGTLAGMIYALLYLTTANKKRDPLPYVVLTHSLNNLIGFIIQAIPDN
jgi:membrane protease YdiL (CAAX protease family)